MKHIQKLLMISNELPKLEGLCFEYNKKKYSIGEVSGETNLYMKNPPIGVVVSGAQEQRIAKCNGKKLDILIYWYKKLEGSYAVILEEIS